MGKTPSGRVQFFDCLRALAITLVIITHYRVDWLPGGSIGVAVFFCLSGYLITSILLKEETLDYSTVLQFLVRRFFRVYPAYVMAILLNLAAMAYFNSKRLDGFIQEIPSLLTFTPGSDTWLGMGTGVFWTLHVEFWFYLSMPVIMLLLGRGRLFTSAMVALFALLTVWKFALPESAFFMLWANNLLLGTLVAIAANSISLTKCGKYYNVICLGALALLVAIALYIPNTDRFLIWPLEALAACLITAIWMISYLGKQPNIQIPIAAWFGRVSYSVYLTHAIPIDYLGVIWYMNSRWALFIASFIVAVAMYYLIEKPFIRLGRFLTEKGKAAIAVV